MFPQHIIARKRDGHVLAREEIAAFVRGATDGSWADYQLSALLMAIYLRGMTPEETACYTDVMMHSGIVADLTAVRGVKVDKHSTGGVGDKVSIPLAPMVVACGVPVPMISGRGLGHSGGRCRTNVFTEPLLGLPALGPGRFAVGTAPKLRP